MKKMKCSFRPLTFSLLDEVSPVAIDNQEELKQEIKRLQIANDKAEYRIKMLLRTLEEKEQK